ncbi:hypothetical protein [Roseimicrobium sp. ORNL1]|uniref:hypothetical protein n=1 Tax=Roseimicrobium sp. ORNL1 TaxID=2711231 RepID=UPI0013E1ADDE|nr:hypothetical protein [Roseimicrobium sp. ORNL1]QIF03108.1 hypothetical protein G5S37_16800 [Roseimicrobium sp. ORNL1]
MRSQKQNNRSPRPFKFKGSERGWSGGRKKDNALPFQKSAPKANQSGGASTEAPPTPPENASSGGGADGKAD